MPDTAAPFQILPVYKFPVAVTAPDDKGTGIASRVDINAAARPIEQTQLTVAAGDEFLPFGYGLNRVGAKILRPVVAGVGILDSALMIPSVIARGPINALVSIDLDGFTPIENTNYHFYDGTQTAATNIGPHTVNGVDQWLFLGYHFQGIVYSDILPGISYAVIMLVHGQNFGLDNITFLVEMNRVYDPRDPAQDINDPTTWVYSTNPPLALADFITNKVYGKGEAIDWDSVADAADVADELVGGQKRREVNVIFDTPTPVDQVEETLRTYAGCWVIREGNIAKLVPDTVASSTHSLTDAPGSANYVRGSLNVETRSRDNSPTVVTVHYTEITTTPWSTARWSEPENYPTDGSLPYRLEEVHLPGIHSHGFAKREAIRRVNEYIACDLFGTVIAMDAATVQRGDVIDITDMRGFTAKPFRVTDIKPASLGRWQIAFSEYQDVVYSDSVATGPQIPDTTLPDPNSPPQVSALVLSEDVVQVASNGAWESHIRATWVEPPWPFVLQYKIEIKQAGVIVEVGSVVRGTTVYVSGPLPEGLLYSFEISVVSRSYAIGVPVVATITLDGKLALPSDVRSITVREIGGEVRCLIEPSVDRDLTAHEYRALQVSAVGSLTTAEQWAVALLLDRVAAPSVRYNTRLLSAGDWRIYVKGLDSVRSALYPFGQESLNAIYADVTVTTDEKNHLVDEIDYTSATFQNMRQVVDPHGKTLWVTDHGETWAQRFPDTLADYVNPLASYWTLAGGYVEPGYVEPGYVEMSGSPLSWIETNHIDWGTDWTGNWLATMAIVNLDGTASFQMHLSAANAEPWYKYFGPAAASGRYTRNYAETEGTMLVTSLGSISLGVVSRDESFKTVTDASNPKTVELIGKYSAYQSLVGSPVSINARYASFDKILLNPSASACLQFQCEHPTGAPDYEWYRFSNVGYTFVAGDVLEYDVMLPSNGFYADEIGGLFINCSDATTIGFTGGLIPVDQNGDYMHIPILASRLLARTAWFHRTIDLTLAVGKTATFWGLISRGYVPSFSVVLIKNVVIKNGASANATAWNYAAGQPSANSSWLNSGSINVQLGLANSFDVYAFNDTGAQVAATVTGNFKGV